MQINSSIQSNVLMAQNKPIQKVEDTSAEQVNEKKIGEEKLGEKKYQEISNLQDDMILKAMNNANKSDLKEDLAKIEDSLKTATNNDRMKSEDFSKLNADFLKQNEESFKNAQQVSLNQSQLASLLA
ncbi:hypothetical protein AVANS_1022 [Campylobacter sp. RM5004]|uniref:hypothetical protein n=1 Tax=Campylobacter sp. RM5004 TaxID=1660078 RepID=UPI001EFA63CC|nr:hypothetical protein [Campylobacter sp. RM5004]ULO01648.1 hypothetical protein AVANS_1022 [Campylobacter sp. RM5004]